MRILHLITALETGGAETALARLLSRLDRAEFEPLVVSLVPPGWMAAELDRLAVPVAHLDMRRGRPTPGGLWRLRGVLRRFDPHLLQTWLYHADLLGLLGARLARPLGGGPPVVWNLRCAYMDLARYPRTTALTLRACARLSARPACVLANSRAALDWHRSLGYRPRRAEVIGNGIDADLFRPDAVARAEVRAELGLAADAPVLVTAARFDPMKDVPGLLGAAARVLAAWPEARWLLCGRGMEPGNAELAALLAAAGLSGRAGDAASLAPVRLLGQRGDMPRLLAAADLAVSASRGESFPNAVAEALACGLPCAATDAGATAELVAEAGRVVPIEDPEALARAVLELLALPPEERARLGAAGRERIRAGHSLEAQAAAYAALYRELARPGA
ncbi:MAG: glycosyltransferase [Desulfovibrionaceae bacterium]